LPCHDSFVSCVIASGVAFSGSPDREAVTVITESVDFVLSGRCCARALASGLTVRAAKKQIVSKRIGRTDILQGSGRLRQRGSVAE
jgi:hypothetical protein